MRRPKPLDPTTMSVVVDGRTPLTPRFYHEELGKAALRQISKVRESAQLQTVEAGPADGSFEDAVQIVSRESRWLAMSRQDKGTFEALCEGWVSMASHTPEASR